MSHATSITLTPTMPGQRWLESRNAKGRSNPGLITLWTAP